MLLGMRQAAKDAGLWLPHMPKEWGGMGLGHVELAMVQAEAAKTPATGRSCSTARRPTRATCTRCCTGRTDEQKEKYLRPLCDGTRCVVLRDDRARGRRLATRR